MDIPDSWVLLVAALSLPPFVLYFCINFCLGRVSKKARRFTLALDPDQGLGEQPLFWLVMLTPVTYFFLFGIVAWTDGYELSLDSYGFKQFWEITTLPVAMLSLAIPLTALVTYLHSTAQTARQIEKNKHELFYIHRNQFVTYYEQIGSTRFSDGLKVSYKINPRVHARLFIGDVAEGTPMRKTQVFNSRIADLKVARRCLVRLMSQPPSPASFIDYLIFCRRVYKLIHFFTIGDLEVILDEASHGARTSDKRRSRLLGLSTDLAVDSFRCVENYLTSAIEFSGYADGLKKLPQGRQAFDKLIDDNKHKRVIESFANAIRDSHKRNRLKPKSPL
ncbi:hypothetical protein QLG14_17325 [Pseudomonas sp. V104_10]|uniref:hypothetical protein n=1 Tax=Pseudomonas sp. V104_10 TaxID=3044231 RepID=UPI00249F77A2|nr:hypothetical protein [Pseudomonas sp. V104_10]MDI3370997.1 hypothetical protein [Pseudomonas sp. V104_10]